MLDGNVVGRSVTERILRHAGPIAADVRAVQMKNAHVEPFDAANLALDIGYGGHVWSKSNPTLRSGKQRASVVVSTRISGVQSTDFSRAFVRRERTQLELVL